MVLNFLLQITREVETFMHMQKCTKSCLKPNKNDDFVWFLRERGRGKWTYLLPHTKDLFQNFPF